MHVKKDDPDAHRLWFELGVDVRLEMVDYEQVEAEVEKIEEDEEVARIYKDSKNKHRKIMMGQFKLNTVL